MGPINEEAIWSRRGLHNGLAIVGARRLLGNTGTTHRCVVWRNSHIVRIVLNIVGEMVPISSVPVVVRLATRHIHWNALVYIGETILGVVACESWRHGWCSMNFSHAWAVLKSIVRNCDDINANVEGRDGRATTKDGIRRAAHLRTVCSVIVDNRKVRAIKQGIFAHTVDLGRYCEFNHACATLELIGSNDEVVEGYIGERCAILKNWSAHRSHSIGHIHSGQARTAVECIFADAGDAVRN